MSGNTLTGSAMQYVQQGREAHARRDFTAARSAYLLAAAAAPGNETVLALLAVLAMDSGDWAAAEPLLRELDARMPGKYRPRLALTLFNLHRYTDALPMLEALVEAGQTDVACILAFAACLERTGDEQRSLRVLGEIYRAVPTADFAVKFASAMQRLHQEAWLEEWLPKLLAAHPAHPVLLATLSEHRLTRGDYAEGFDLAHHRWHVALESARADSLPCPAWDGEVFPGLLLVTAEQGLGDEILASSLFADLHACGQRSLVECEPRLLPLFRRSFPGLDFTSRHGEALASAAARENCRKIPALELGRYFRRKAAAFPARARWLESDPARRASLRAQLQQRFPGKRLAGLSWRSARAFLGDAKSIPLATFAPLLRDERTAWIDLQYGDTSEERSQLQAASGLTLHRLDEPDNTQDIDGLAALIDALDEVVSSSNTTVHIAGALGKPVAALVPGTRYALWYWGYQGSRTPWYPGITLYRGPSFASWETLITQVAAQRAGL